MTMLSDERLVRRMTIRSLAAVGLLAGLVVGGSLLFQQQAQTLESTAQVINLSGRQRMLSQRAVLLAQELMSAEEPAARRSLRSELSDLAESMELTHRSLLQGDAELGLPPSDPATVKAIYFEPPHDLNRNLHAYLALIRGIAKSDGVGPGARSSYEELRARALDDRLVGSFDAVVAAFGAERETRLRTFRRAQLAVLGLILGLLLFTTLGVFLPLARHLRRDLRNLRASQERFRQVADNIREVFWMYNRVRRRITYVSPAYEQVWGRRPSRLLEGAFGWLDAVHPVDRERVASRLHEAEGGRAYEDTYRIVRGDGTIRWILDRAFAVRDEEGRVVRIAGLAEDVTERRLASERHREQAEELRLTFENAPVGIASCDVTGRILNVNQAFCKALGYEEEELIELRETELTHPDNFPETIRTYRRAARGDLRVFTLEKRYVRKDGQIVDGLVRGSVVRSADGRPRRLILQLEDRTERLKAEREAREHRDRLAHVTRMATMGELAAGIAHEVNQPLTAITTFSDACRRMLLRGDGDRNLVADILVKVREQAHRAGEVIRRLRSMVKRSGSSEEPTDLNELVREAAHLARADARLHGLKLKLSLTPDLPQVLVDRIQIQQVLLNLVRNGIEAVESDSAFPHPIEISTTVEDGAPRLTVSDRGPGVPEERLPRLFEPFFSTKEGGLGIGLSISHSIVTNHGGELTYEPRPGGGSSFHVTLPAAAAANELQHGAA